VGLAAVGFTAVYLISDLIEVAQGGFSTFRLSLTYAGEAAIPLFVIGLYAVQRPRIGHLGFFGAVAYAYSYVFFTSSYVFFTSTVVYALIAGTPNYAALVKVFGAWMTVHGLIMLVGGLAFGLAVVRAGVLPRWTGVCLMAGVVLVVAASGLPNVARTVAAVVPDTAFIGMGLALLANAGSRAPGRHAPRWRAQATPALRHVGTGPPALLGRRRLADSGCRIPRDRTANHECARQSQSRAQGPGIHAPTSDVRRRQHPRCASCCEAHHTVRCLGFVEL
jgi:hypothetical protein